MRLRLPAGTASIFAFNCLTIGLNMAASVPVARLLGPTQKGILNLFSLLTGLLAEFGVLGLNSGLLYQLANRKAPLAFVHAAAVQASVICGAGCLSLLVVFRPAILRAFEGLPQHFVLAAGFLAPLLIYRMLWGSLVVGINRAVHNYRTNLVLSALAIFGLLGLWGVGQVTAAAMIWLNIGLVVAAGIYNLLYMARLHRFRFQWGQPCLVEAMKYGAIAHVGAVANYLHSRLDQTIINYFQGPRSVGIYTVSVAAAELLWLIDYAIINASLFRISSSEPQASWHFTWRLFRLTSVLLVGSGLLLGGLAGPLVRLLYGQEFLEAVWPLRLLLPGVIAWGASRILSQFVAFNAGKPHLTTGAAILGSGLNVALNFYAIPRWGLAGAAAASAISYLVTLGAVGSAFGLLGWRLRVPQ